jgi:hypothetical protein
VEHVPDAPLYGKSIQLTGKACQGKHSSLFVNYKEIKKNSEISHILCFMFNQLEQVFSTHLCLQEVSTVNIVKNTFLITDINRLQQPYS